MSTSRTIYIAIIGVVTLVGAYVLLQQEGVMPLSAQEFEDTAAPADSGTVTAVIGSDLIATIEKVNAIKLDRALFTDDAFLSLIDFATPIAPQPVGRDNPFLPVPGLRPATN